MNANVPDAATIQGWSIDFVSRLIDQPAERIDPNVEVERLGLDSATAVALIMSLEERLGIELMPELLFDYPTISSLSQHLASRVASSAERSA
ncbi:MAG: acyl carrier protein [Acidobacteriota bacterium]|nr:acyl carrier protein [Acidobacteriota bacterium]